MAVPSANRWQHLKTLVVKHKQAAFPKTQMSTIILLPAPHGLHRRCVGPSRAVTAANEGSWQPPPRYEQLWKHFARDVYHVVLSRR